MRGFQLWVNLPAREKMKPASYRDIQSPEMPVAALPGGGSVKVIAGTFMLDGRPTPGPIQGLTTDLLYLDADLPAGGILSQPVQADYNAFLYAYEGSVTVGPEGAARVLDTHRAGVLSQGDRIEVKAGAAGARLLILAGRPLREPVVQYGPFVMNTREEIEQAIRDYQAGVLTRPAA